MKKNYFVNVNSIEELKKQYRRLAFRYHPDREGGNEEIFKMINNEYEELFKELSKKSNKEAKKEDTKKTNTEDIKNDNFRNIINALINYADGIEIDIVGSWVWVYGNTYKIKEILKMLGFRWSANKKKWYYAQDLGTKKRGYSKYNYNQIKNIYGCEKVNTENKKATLIEG